jgi:hypothetical protein
MQLVEPTLDGNPIALEPSPENQVVPQPEAKRSRNYIVRHWVGDLPLWISYWVNLILLATAIPLGATAMLAPAIEGWSLRTVAIYHVSYLLMAIALWLWGIVGVWQSADRHVSRGGSGTWATLAKVAVVLGAISVSGQLATSIGPQLKEFGLIAIGSDPIGDYRITILNDGKSAHIRGMLREGSARDIARVLEATPAVTTIVLSSNGGRLAEAKAIAEIVKARAMNTYVDDKCISACTFIFIAGKDRAAYAKARIGFHAPSTPGTDRNLAEGSRQYARDVYRSADLPDWFIKRALADQEIWYPTREELIRARVLTRVAFNRESTVLFSTFSSKEELALGMRGEELFRAIANRFPDVFDQALEKGWAVKTAGGKDGEILTAMRSTIDQAHGRLLKAGDDRMRESFTLIILEQLRAAKSVSPAACEKLLHSQIDPSTIFPQELIIKEKRWLLENLAKTPSRTKARDKRTIQDAVNAVLDRLPRNYLPVLANLEKHRNQPALVCDATIALYTAAMQQPPKSRAAALEGLFSQL